MSPYLLSFDAISVAVFVVIGRASHHEDAAGFVHTAAPFFIGLLVGWLVTRAWRQAATMRVGIGVTVATVVIGIALRRLVFSDGIATTFIVVAAAFLTLFLLGWRVVVGMVARRA